MKKLIFIGLITCGVIGLSSCEPNVIGNCIVEREFRRTAYFDEIELLIPADVIVRQGTAKDIEIEAEINVLNYLETRISRNTLRIAYNGNWVRVNRPVKIWIQIPEIDAIRVSGSGRVISDNKIFAKNLVLRMSGGGLIDVAADVQNQIDANVSGSGKIYLEGEADEADYDLSGSGKIEGFAMSVKDTDIEISGSGIVETTTYKALSVSISGSGDAYFRGKPSIRTRYAGTGRLFDAN